MKYKITVVRDSGEIDTGEFDTREEVWDFMRDRVVDIPLEGEIWKDVPKYANRIQASNYGRIRSFYEGNVQVLAQHSDRYGYVEVKFHFDGKTRYERVHRLVAYAFIPNPNNLPEVNHKDFDKTNNTLANLEWCNNKYNIEYNKNRGKYISPQEHINRSNAVKQQWAKRIGNMQMKYKFTNVYTGEVLLFKTITDAVKQLGGKQQGYFAVYKGKYKKHNGYFVEKI